MLGLQPLLALGLLPNAPVLGPRLAHRGLVAMSAEQQGAEQGRTYRVELMAQKGSRSAVGSLTREGQQETYVGVPPPGYQDAAPPSFMQRARTPFLGVTFMATALVAGWQSNRMYKVRQQGLLDQFAVTMIYHMGDERETALTVKSFRQQLGPGKFRNAMFAAYVKQLAVDAPIGVKTITELKRVVSQMQLSQSAIAQLLGEAFDALEKQPSVLGKLVFTAERAVPAAAAQAQLRTKFPKWDEDMVGMLQRSMLENLYREMVDEPGSDEPATLEILGLTAAEATRLKEEVAANKAEAAAKAEAEAAERARAEQLQEAIRKASEPSPAPARAGEDGEGGGVTMKDAPSDARAEGTHEYECTECGYVMFPAAGREFKFFGDDFKCPTPGCGADKSSFVDNGVVDEV